MWYFAALSLLSWVGCRWHFNYESEAQPEQIEPASIEEHAE